MGHGIQAFPCDHAGLLQITQRIPHAHQVSAEAAAGRITDAHSFDQLWLVHAALCQVGQGFWMLLQLELIEMDDVAQQRTHA